MPRILAIAKKEFFGFINQALGYVVMVPFLVLVIFFWLRVALVRNEADLRSFFDLLPWFLLFLAPALTMRSLAEEQRRGTANLLFAHPLSEWQIVTGKFLGILWFWLVILGGTLGLPITLLVFSRPDLGQIFSQYLGGIFLGAGFLAVGIAASSLVNNALGAFLLGVVGNFALLFLGTEFILLSVPYPLNQIFSQLSWFTHLESFSRGVIDFRDLLWFLTIIGLGLLVAVFRLSYRRLVEKPVLKRRLIFVFGIFLALGVLGNVIFSVYPLRLDLTFSRLYTLSEGTRKILKDLPDLVTINFYASRDLPPEMHQVYQAVADLLEDYRKAAKKNLVVKISHPDLSSELENEAQRAGITPVTFSTIGAGKFGMQKGYLGLAIRFGEKTETLPFISKTDDLEYQLSRRIQKLVSGKETKIGFYKTGTVTTQILEEVLQSQYQLSRIYQLEEKNLGDISALLVIDDGSTSATQSAVLENYLNRNGKIFYLGNGVSVNPQYLFASKTQSTLWEAFKNWGITLNQDLVYDLQLNEILAFSDGQRRYLLSYPFWLKGLVGEKFGPLGGIKTVTFGWPSSLKIEEKEGIKYQKIFFASSTAGRQKENFDVSPNIVKSLPAPTKEEIVLGVIAEKGEGKLVVVGNALWVEDQFVANSQANLAAVVNLLDWLTASAETASIPLKSRGQAVFLFRNSWQPLAVQIGNLAGPTIIIVGWAFWWLGKRKRLAKS
ncbi:MAG: DUF7088 domain-containing protein [Microgenomates group bacterium]